MTNTTPYSADHEPAAPVLTIRVTGPQPGPGVALLGLVDTGADLTLIPEPLASALNLPLLSRVRVAGVTGAHEVASVFAANIELADRTFLAEVVAFDGEVIVGRDLLNQLTLRLDGPRRALHVQATRPRRAGGGRGKRAPARS